MSFEVLSSTPYVISSGEPVSYAGPMSIAVGSNSVPPVKQVQVKHHPIHDLEGLFWVTCFLCMSRDGPARSLNPAPGSVTAEQQLALKSLDTHFLFDSVEQMMVAKKLLIQMPNEFSQNILAHVQPYFQPLLGLVQWLYNALRYAYMTRTFTGIHDDLLASLKTVGETSVVKTWHDLPEHHKYAIMEREEEQRRREDRGDWEVTPQSAPATRTGNLTSIPEGSSSLSALTESSQDESPPSSARPGKRRKLNDSPAGAAAGGIRRSTRLSSAPRVPVHAETPSPSERSRKRKRQSLGNTTASSSGSNGTGRGGGGSSARGGNGGRGVGHRAVDVEQAVGSHRAYPGQA
ncbi:hypothetical protein OF83DRAFT_519644 [Amylostereum chailletii]|nr:hypothetical protein OF83DRAFT_519644 [Amylostereum chailletii]